MLQEENDIEIGHAEATAVRMVLICSVDVTIFWSWRMMLSQILQGSSLIKMLVLHSELIMQGKWAVHYYVQVVAHKGNARWFV